MLIDFLFVFIIITIFCFFIVLFIMYDNPVFALPVIMLGMITSILSTYGLWDVEYISAVFNSSSGSTESYIHVENMGDPYGYIFLLLFFVNIIFFVYCGFRYWQIILEDEKIGKT